MMVFYYSLDVVPGGVKPQIHVSQGDTNSKICFTLFARTGDFSLESNTGVSLRGRRADGTSVTVIATLSGDQVTVALTDEMTAVAGTGIYEVVLRKNGKELATANFYLNVEKKA